MNVLLVPISSTLTAAYKTEMQLEQEKQPALPSLQMRKLQPWEVVFCFFFSNSQKIRVQNPKKIIMLNSYSTENLKVHRSLYSLTT